MNLAELQEWAKKMRYRGEIPNESRVFNEATANIWKQVVDRIRPKYEVEQIRRNILIRKLQACKKSVTVSSDVLDCRNKELEVWRKRQQLQKDAEDVKRACKDADMELTKAKAQSNLLMTDIDVIDASIKESESKQYLNMKKEADLTEKIRIIEKKLQFINKTINCLDTHENKSGLSVQIEEYAQKAPDKHHKEEIHELYTNNGRDHLINVIQEKNEVLKEEIQGVIDKYTVTAENYKKLFKESQEKHKPQLYALHIEKSLEILKLNKKISLKEEEFHRKYNDLLEYFTKSNPLQQKHEVKQRIDQILQESEEETLYNFNNKSNNELNREMKQFVTSEVDKSKSTRKAENILINKTKSLQNKLKTYLYLENSIREQHHFTEDKMASMLNHSMVVELLSGELCKNLIQEEIALFAEFNLEFNRRFTYSKQDGYYRDMHFSSLPFITVDDAVLRKIVLSLGVTITQPEKTLKYFVEKVKEYKKCQEYYQKHVKNSFVFDSSTNNTYDLKHLQQSIEWMNPLIYQLQALTASTITTQSNAMRKSLDIWQEMSLTQDIPKEILYKGENYYYYEEKYNNYLRQLK